VQWAVAACGRGGRWWHEGAGAGAGGAARRCVCVCGPVGMHCVDKTPYLRQLNFAIIDKVLFTSAALGRS
jgi:hypothetical protein